PPGERASEADAVHSRFRPRAGEAHMLQAWDRAAQEAGKLGVLFILVRARRAAFQCRFDSLAHARITVAEQRRSVAATQVDVLAPVEVPDPAARGTVEQHGMSYRAIEPRR